MTINARYTLGLDCRHHGWMGEHIWSLPKRFMNADPLLQQFWVYLVMRDHNADVAVLFDNKTSQVLQVYSRREAVEHDKKGREWTANTTNTVWLPGRLVQRQSQLERLKAEYDAKLGEVGRNVWFVKKTKSGKDSQDDLSKPISNGADGTVEDMGDSITGC